MKVTFKLSRRNNPHIVALYDTFKFFQNIKIPYE